MSEGIQQSPEVKDSAILKPIDRAKLSRDGLRCLAVFAGYTYRSQADLLANPGSLEKTPPLTDIENYEISGPDGKKKIYLLRHGILETARRVEDRVIIETVGQIGISLSNLRPRPSFLGTTEWVKFSLQDGFKDDRLVESFGETTFMGDPDEPGDPPRLFQVGTLGELRRFRKMRISRLINTQSKTLPIEVNGSQ